MKTTNLTVALSTLKPHPRNYNRHPAQQVKRIAASLREFGQVRSIVVWRSFILAGHGVVEAARAAGWSEIRADVLPDDYPEHLALAYVAADNELARQGDPDMAQLAAILEESRAADAALLEAIGYSDAEFDALLKEVGRGQQAVADAPAQVDRAEELRQQWGVEPGQLWQLGEHRLICGDCTDAAVVARVMGGETLDGLVTDPPYSSGGFTRGDRQAKTGAKYQFNADDTGAKYLDFAGDNKDQRSWITWCHLWLSIWLRHAKEGAPFALFIDWRQLPALTDAVQSAGWLWRGVAVWDKTEAARPLYGRFKPQAEFVVWGSAGPLPLNDGSPAYPGVIRCAVETAGKMHLTQKPLDVGKWSLSMIAQGGVVVDPFSGSGTTIIACEQLGRRCRAVEIAPGYVAVALQRWADATGKTPVLVE